MFHVLILHLIMYINIILEYHHLQKNINVGVWRYFQIDELIVLH